MKVLWHLPDNTVTETAAKDIEQLLFMLRLVQRVTLLGSRYRVIGTELLVGKEEVAVSVQLQAGEP